MSDHRRKLGTKRAQVPLPYQIGRPGQCQFDLEGSTLVFLYADVREVGLERHVYVE